MKCPKCGGRQIWRNGHERGRQRYKCGGCGYRFFTPADGVSVKKIFTKSKNMGITEEQLRQKHDVVYILSQVFKKIETEEENTFYEKSDIIKLANLSPGYPGIGTVLESENFKKYSGKAGGTTYWGKSAAITKLKEEGIMR